MKYFNENANMKKKKITLIGIGGAGNNAINRVINNNPHKIEFIAVNTDQSELDLCNCHNKLLIGQTLQGHGAMGQAELGRKAAEESSSKIREMLKGIDVLIIRCGLGRGTGSGASSVVSRVAKELGILTIAVVTKPFEFEDVTYIQNANEQINELQKEVDILLAVSNQMVLKTVERHTPLPEALDKIELVCWNMINQLIERLEVV